ncbi:MAG: galactokinase [Terriglobales bacterium]
MELVSTPFAGLQTRFGASGRVYRAPGRVNLIGEHTDYNDGYVLPAAINLACGVAIAARNDRTLHIQSSNMPGDVHVHLDRLPAVRTGHWSDYVIGIASALEQAGFKLPGASLYIQSEVPLGSGLSSSAALETSVAYALLDAAGYPIDLRKLALLCQRVENEYVGARCGIMDPFIACHGKGGHALLLDCRSLDFRLLRVPPQARLVICNTMVKHELASSQYNLRRAECEEAVRLLATKLPCVRSLRDVSNRDLEGQRSLLTATLYKRACHVVEENDRVLGAESALKAGNLTGFGELMAQSHLSLKDNYEVSCRELDLMVEIANRTRGVYGARMTGGGFGGCTVNLVRAETAADFAHQVGEAYYGATGRHPDVYICEIAEGVGPVS